MFVMFIITWFFKAVAMTVITILLLLLLLIIIITRIALATIADILS